MEGRKLINLIENERQLSDCSCFKVCIASASERSVDTNVMSNILRYRRSSTTFRSQNDGPDSTARSPFTIPRVLTLHLPGQCP